MVSVKQRSSARCCLKEVGRHAREEWLQSRRFFRIFSSRFSSHFCGFFVCLLLWRCGKKQGATQKSAHAFEAYTSMREQHPRYRASLREGRSANSCCDFTLLCVGRRIGVR